MSDSVSSDPPLFVGLLHRRHSAFHDDANGIGSNSAPRSRLASGRNSPVHASPRSQSPLNFPVSRSHHRTNSSSETPRGVKSSRSTIDPPPTIAAGSNLTQAQERIRLTPISPLFLSFLSHLPQLPLGASLGPPSFADAAQLMDSRFPPGTAICSCSRTHQFLDSDREFIESFLTDRCSVDFAPSGPASPRSPISKQSEQQRIQSPTSAGSLDLSGSESVEIDVNISSSSVSVLPAPQTAESTHNDSINTTGDSSAVTHADLPPSDSSSVSAADGESSLTTSASGSVSVSSTSSSPTSSAAAAAAARAFSFINSPILTSLIAALDAALASDPNSTDPSRPSDSVDSSSLVFSFSPSAADRNDPMQDFFAPSPLIRCLDYLECLFSHLQLLRFYLSDAVELYQDRQMGPTHSCVPRFQFKVAELMDQLKGAKRQEEAIRERIDQAAMEVEKAKKTVRVGQHLAIANVKQEREIQKLEQSRIVRSDALKQLESVVTERSILQNQLTNLTGLIQLFQVPVDRRDYKSIYKEIQNPFFVKSFTIAEQSEFLDKVRYCAKAKKSVKECQEKLVALNELTMEVRARIDELISMNWK